mmetsp:Transcript_1512/g.1787  ORF Transcript_1512/g.1787 Transcript_1512/m.1787 type:complete len:341 (+) Transcript_1512:696-1718(+)
MTLINALVHGASVMSQTLIKGSENETSTNSVITWNLLRGGIALDELSPISSSQIKEFKESIAEEKGLMFEICSGIRSIAPVFETKLPPILAAKFDAEMEKKWNYVTNLSMICLMYHSDILKEIITHKNNSNSQPSDMLKVEEKFKIVWRYTHSIMKWMQNSLQGEREIQLLIKDALAIAQTLIQDKRESFAKKWVELKEKERKEKEDRQKHKQEAELKRIAEEKEVDNSKKGKVAVSSVNQKVAVSKDLNKHKKQNRKKLLNQVVIPKQKKKDRKQEENEEKKAHEHEEDHKEADKEAQKEEVPPELSDKELSILNTQIYNDVYSFLLTRMKEPSLLQNL